MDVNAIDLTGADDALADDLAAAAADNLKRVIRPRDADADWTGPAKPAPPARLPGNQDRLAPHRNLTGDAVRVVSGE